MNKSTRTISALFSLTLFFATGCGPSSADRWAQTAIQQKVKENALIVDVRTPAEYNTNHVKGAINIPHTEIRSRINEVGEEKSAPIVVYCGIGGRAETAKKILEEEGYRNVWNLGGFSNLAKGGVAVEATTIH